MTLLGCSGVSSQNQGGTTTTTPTTSTKEDDAATFMEWSGSAWDSLNTALTAGKTLTAGDCPDGGSLGTTDSQNFTLTNCKVKSDSGVVYEGNGTYSITESGSIVTHAWDQDLSVTGGQTFSSKGGINFETETGDIAFDFTATFTSGLFELSGIVQNNNDGTTNAILKAAFDGIAWWECNFSNVKLSALTQAIVTSSCSTDVNTACASTTTACEGDFQCQLFADNHPDSGMTTANARCTSGCCTAVSQPASCGTNSTACSSDFQCQEFLSNQVAAGNDICGGGSFSCMTCSNGCCTLQSR